LNTFCIRAVKPIIKHFVYAHQNTLFRRSHNLGKSAPFWCCTESSIQTFISLKDLPSLIFLFSFLFHYLELGFQGFVIFGPAAFGGISLTLDSKCVIFILFTNPKMINSSLTPAVFHIVSCPGVHDLLDRHYFTFTFQYLCFVIILFH
jgi:hypothetical protein